MRFVRTKWLLFQASLLTVLLVGIPIYDCVENKRLQRSRRIINGEDVENQAAPWKVVIKGRITFRWDLFRIFSRTNYCGATIINNRWIITAAHCFEFQNEKEHKIYSLADPYLWHARIGSIKREANLKERIDGYLARFWNHLMGISLRQEYYHFDKIVLHPLYKSDVLEHDIALVKTVETLPVNLGKYNVDILPGPTVHNSRSAFWPPVTKNCTIVGWGCTHQDGSIVSLAKKANLAVLGNKECRRIYGAEINLTDSREFCAGYFKRGVGICPGDSGSGLVCSHGDRWILSGVASATHSSRPSDYPGIFTRIAAYTDWIKSTLHAG